MHSQDKTSNFDFSTTQSVWKGYISSVDRTNLPLNVMVQGAKNMYKKLSGTLAVREGQKRLGVADSTASAISSSFVWNTSWGKTYTMVVADSKLSVVINDVWYELLGSLTSTRYVFDKWWDNTAQKDVCLFVHGNSDIDSWQGGFGLFVSANITPGVITTMVIDSAGSGYAPADVLTITGGGGTLGTATVNTVDSSGAIKTITLLAGGSGYSTTVGATTTGGGGTGATISITVTTGIITLDRNAQQNGFSNGSVIINGNTYTYTGVSGNTLTGVGSDASAEPANSPVLSAVVVNSTTPASGFNNDFIKVVNNQVYVGSYTSRLCYISSNSDFTNYTVPTPRLAGSPELLTLDATLNGISVRQGNAYISFGTDSWAAIIFNDITVGTTLTQQTKVDIKPVAVNQAAYSHEMISSVGDNIVYLAKDHQVRVVGDFNNAFTPRYPSFSQDIATELTNENFNGGALTCIGEFIYVTAPANGNVYLRQERTNVDNNGNSVLEILWHSPFIWNLTKVDSRDGVIIGFSNANPQIYQLWDTGQWFDDSPSDEPLPYQCTLALAYQILRGRRQGLESFDKLYTEGYMTQDTPLTATVNYNYKGATSISNMPINVPPNRLAWFFTPNEASPSSLGDNILGDELLGDEYSTDNNDQETLPKFRNINSVSLTNCFEYQIVYNSNSSNARWEILACGTNVELETEQQATFLINKLRT